MKATTAEPTVRLVMPNLDAMDMDTPIIGT